MRTAILAAMMMTGCGYEPMWDLMIAQMPLADLPDQGQEIKAINPINPGSGYESHAVTGFVVSATSDGHVARTSEVPEMSDLFHLTVDSQQVFQEGAQVRWSNGRGIIVQSTRLQLYGIKGSL